MWKDIKDFEGRYQVNDIGEVRNINTGKIIINSLDCDGYHQIGIRKLGDRKKYWFRVHRLVAFAFTEVPDNWKELMIDHNDRNKLNNVPSNLRWVTAQEN
jgi:hypothetical protein